MARRRGLFPPDRGLQARMLAAALGCVVLCAAMLIGALFLLALLDGELRFWATVAVLVVMGHGGGVAQASPTGTSSARLASPTARSLISA